MRHALCKVEECGSKDLFFPTLSNCPRAMVGGELFGREKELEVVCSARTLIKPTLAEP